MEDGDGEGSWDQYADQIQYYAVDGEEDSDGEEDEESGRDTTAQAPLEGSVLVDAQGQAVMLAYNQSHGQTAMGPSYGAVAAADAGYPETKPSDPGAYQAPVPAVGLHGVPQNEYVTWPSQASQAEYSAQMHSGFEPDGAVHAIY